LGDAARPVAPAPLLGGDTADVLREALGIEGAELSALVAAGAVRLGAAGPEPGADGAIR
jgi:hypothetical protein